MRWMPKAIPVMVAVIALDFTLVFGFESFRVLTSPVYGLDQTAFANLNYGIGRVFGFGSEGVIRLAAFFGAVYLTIAVVFTLHLATRVASLRGAPVSHDLLDAALILVVIVTIVASTPAVLQGQTDLIVQDRLPLWLVGLAATLSMIERLPEDDNAKPGVIERWWTRFLERRRRRDEQTVAPAIRPDGPAGHLNDLRSEAGMIIEPPPIVRSLKP